MGYDRAGVRGDGCEKRLLITRRGMTAIGRRRKLIKRNKPRAAPAPAHCPPRQICGRVRSQRNCLGVGRFHIELRGIMKCREQNSASRRESLRGSYTHDLFFFWPPSPNRAARVSGRRFVRNVPAAVVPKSRLRISPLCGSSIFTNRSSQISSTGSACDFKRLCSILQRLRGCDS